MYKRKLKFLVIVVLAVCLAGAFFFWKSVDSYTFHEAAFYPALGSKYSISSGDTAVLDKDTGIATIETEGGTQIQSDEMSVFSEDRDAVILTRSMAFFPAYSGDGLKCYKLSAFTDIAYDGENVLISRDGRSRLTAGMFLYNGNNSYILLQDAVLSVDGKEISLSPLSYVIACASQWVQYYDRESDAYEIIYLSEGKRVDISFPSSDFTVHADLDRATGAEGDYMFISAVDYLEDYLQ